MPKYQVIQHETSNWKTLYLKENIQAFNTAFYIDNQLILVLNTKLNLPLIVNIFFSIFAVIKEEYLDACQIDEIKKNTPAK